MRSDYHIIPLRDNPSWNDTAADWFHSKWGVPKEAYLESILDCQKNPAGIPQWYLVLNETDEIVAGLGVIENDFHKRTDLTPNVCAVYVEEAYRRQGIARYMLNHVCRELSSLGIADAYLLTDHTDFYEKCGWEFYCMVEEDGGGMARMYHRKTNQPDPTAIEAFWQNFLKEHQLDSNLRYLEAFYFDMTKDTANALLELVSSGQKKATASSLYSWEAEGTMPKAGDYSIVTDWDGNPHCVIKTTKVTTLPFCQIDFELCSKEGEDDCLESWQQSHRAFFTAEGREELNYEFHEDMMVVFEEFEKVYP